MTDSVPVIDIREIDDATSATFDRACREWGFFQITGHGISRQDLDQLRSAMELFFRLDTSLKHLIRRTPTNPWGFYDQELTKNRRDWKEILDLGNDALPPDDTFPDAANQWPSLAGFRPVMERHFAACVEISHRLVGAIARNLGAKEPALTGIFDNHTSYLRLNYYPICPDPAAADSATVPETGELGISHHTDAGAVTVLVQEDVASLQVQKDERWIIVEPNPNALVVNLGDVVQVWSNDRYRAPLHRVLADDERNRHSAAFFFNPAYEADYASIVDEPTRYRPINWGEFRRGRAGGDYQDLGEEIQIRHYRIETLD